MTFHPAPSPEQLLALLEALIRETPTFKYQEPLSEDDLRWLGRANALLEASGATPALVSFRVARQGLGSFTHDRSALLIPLHDAYYRAELMAPAASQGGFIPAGDTWKGYAAIVKLVQRDCDELLVVDPYLNSDFFTEFIPHAAAKKTIRGLTTKRTENHPALLATAGKWARDAASKGCPVELRYAPNGALHDRLIIIDGHEVWLVTQSLKDIAKRSPASVSRAESEVGKLKAQHYDSVWQQSTPLA